jgi:hypothetical protein
MKLQHKKTKLKSSLKVQEEELFKRKVTSGIKAYIITISTFLVQSEADAVIFKKKIKRTIGDQIKRVICT